MRKFIYLRCKGTTFFNNMTNIQKKKCTFMHNKFIYVRKIVSIINTLIYETSMYLNTPK